MTPPRPGLAEYLMIVPTVHLRVLDYAFQADIFDVFHRHWITRIVHGVSSSAIMIGSFALLAGAVPLGDLALAVLLLAWWAALRPGVAAAAAIPLVATLGAASVLGSGLDAATPGAAVALVVAGAILQTFSHLAEDVPPPWSRAPGWAPLRVALTGLSPRRLAGLAALVVSACFLEWWATYRIFALQWWLVALWLGVTPAERARILARRAEMGADFARVRQER